MSETSAPTDPFSITLFGRPAIGGEEIAGALAPTLLSLLAVRANDPVEFDVLIDQIYRFEPPATAGKTIQNQIVRLRRALARTDAELETVGTAYRLIVDPMTVDVLAIDQGIADDIPEARHRTLSSVKPLWRNRPFSGCRPAPMLDARQLHLSRTITRAVELWAEAELSDGADPSSELEWALSENPYSDRLWELLVGSHHRHGRPDRGAAAVESARAAMAEIGARPPDSLTAEPDDEQRPSTKHTEGGLIGRSGEIARLLQLLEHARSGEGAVALLTGAAGIGKTALSRAVADAARNRRERIGWGRCWSRGENPEFWVWRDAFADAFGGELADALEGVEHDLPIAVRRLTDHVIATVGDDPVVMVLDDVHDADAASLHLLASIAAAAERSPLLVVATARTGVEWAGGINPLEGSSHLETIRLAPWSTDDLELYLRSRAGRQPDPADVAAIFERSGGNPFVVERVAHAVGQRGDRADEIDVLLGHHLEQLRADSRTVVEICALAGRPIPLSVLAEVLGRPFATSLRAVTAAIAAGFLRQEPNDDVDVHHPAVRDAVEHRLAPDDLRRLHGMLATALCRDPAAFTDVRAVRIAHHALAALAPGESDDRAVRAAEAAGDVSLAATAPGDAAHWYGRAREIVERSTDDDEHREVLAHFLILEGRALGLAGHDHDALAALQRAAAIALDARDSQLAASAAIELMRHRNRTPHRLYLPQTELVATAELALSADPDPATAAMLHSALVAEAYGRRDYATVTRHAEAAMPLAEASDDVEAEVRALLAWRIALAVQPERTDEWCATTERAARLAEPTGDAVLIRAVDALRLTDGLTTGNLELLVGLGSRGPARAAELPEHAEFGALAVQSQVATAQGRYDDARRHLDHIAEMSASVPSVERMIVAFYARMALGFDVGYDDELIALCEIGARTRPVFASRVGLGFAYAAVGRDDDARRVLIEECNPDPRLVPRDDSWLLGMSMAAWAAWVVGERHIADALVDVLSPLAHLNGLPATGPLPWVGSVGLHAAAAAVASGRLEEAESLLAAADDMHRRLTVTPWLLRNDLVRGDLLARRGAIDEANALLERVRRDATDLGATAIAARAGDLLPR